MPADRKIDEPSDLGRQSALSAVGISLVLAVVIGFAIGYWLYRLTGQPLLLFLFFFLGVAAGIVNVVRTAGGLGGGSKKPPGSGQP